MNMRWACILPVLSSLALTLAPPSVIAQVSRPAAGVPQVSDAGYAALAQAAQAQAAMAQAAMPQGPYGVPVMYAPPGMAPMMGPAPGMYPQYGMYPPNMQAAAYAASMAGAGAPPGAFPGAMAAPMAGAPDAYGSYGALPVEYGPQMPGGMPGGMPPGMSGGMPAGMSGGGGDCPYCGGRGCEMCNNGDCGLAGGLKHGLLGDILGCIGPYPDGGCAAIRWYDFAIDFMMLKRDDAGRNVDITARGGGAPVLLSTNDLDFDYEPSFRFTGVVQVGPGSDVEFTYYGLFQHNASGFVRDPTGFLFSVFSDFGTDPLFGFPETDFSLFQRIEYRSTFDSFEVNYRQRWMSPNCRYQGSWLVGARHFILDEKFRYETVGRRINVLNPADRARLRSDTDTTNNLTGIQAGGDFWICLLPGLRLGAEAKAGVYGNHAGINNTIGVNDIVSPFNPFLERLTTNDVSFLCDANVQATYRLNYQWTLRGGYNLLFVDGVALAPENLNPVLPFFGDTRTPKINDNGNVFYHGWNVGLEFMW
jgi:hypothetical protein